MALQGVGSTSGVSRKPVSIGGHARVVAQAFQAALPSLFNDSAAEKAMAGALKGKALDVVAKTGTDAKGSVTLSYGTKNVGQAKDVAKNLQGKWSSSDESWVGDNVSLPDTDQLTGFRAKAEGTRLLVTLRWAPSNA